MWRGFFCRECAHNVAYWLLGKLQGSMLANKVLKSRLKKATTWQTGEPPRDGKEVLGTYSEEVSPEMIHFDDESGPDKWFNDKCEAVPKPIYWMHIPPLGEVQDGLD
jgi:hypothetical protein